MGNAEHVDRLNKRFFMRTEIEGEVHPDRLISDLRQVLPKGAFVQVKTEGKKKALILATKEAHCIGDLMLRCWDNGLNMDIQAVISNHNTLKDLVDRFDLPYYFISHDGLVASRLIKNNRAVSANKNTIFCDQLYSFCKCNLFNILS